MFLIVVCHPASTANSACRCEVVNAMPALSHGNSRRVPSDRVTRIMPTTTVEPGAVAAVFAISNTAKSFESWRMVSASVWSDKAR